MALSGGGTQADPYIIHDWDELAQAVQTSNSYSELANDITAPSSSVNLDMSSMTQLDGKGYAVIGLRCTSDNCLRMANTNKVLQNIKFKKIHMDGGEIFLATDLGNYKSIALSNVSFSGMFESGMLTNDSAGYYTYNYTADGVGINIKVYNSDFRLMGLRSSTSMSGAFANVNGIIRYIGCSPSASLFDKSSGRKTLKKSTLRIEIPSDGAKLDIGATLNAVDIYGSGAGIIIDSASGVCVVEDTLTLETALANVYSVSTSVIKDPQALHDDYGFPIGVD